MRASWSFLLCDTRQADEVTDWNQTMLRAGLIAGNTPTVMSRVAALVQSAVFDAVNGINPRYTPVFVTPAGPPDASRRAAAVQAAYTMSEPRCTERRRPTHNRWRSMRDAWCRLPRSPLMRAVRRSRAASRGASPWPTPSGRGARPMASRSPLPSRTNLTLGNWRAHAEPSGLECAVSGRRRLPAVLRTDALGDDLAHAVPAPGPARAGQCAWTQRISTRRK